MAPRRLTLDPKHASFNKVIRLEGQINTAIEILRFRSRYQEVTQDAAGSLSVAREHYFSFIDILQKELLDKGLDLAGAGRLEGLVRMVTNRYLPQVPIERRDMLHQWPKVLWFQRLQGILENQNLSVEQSLVDGWCWFMDPDQYPVKFRTDFRIHEYASLWHAIDAVQQAEFLKTFAIDEASLKNWPTEIQLLDLNQPSIRDIEADGLEKEIRYAYDSTSGGILLDIDHPQVNKPASQDFSDCPICLQSIVKEETYSVADHRPVETTCGHVFGYSCLRHWFRKEWKCPMCREDLSFSVMYKASAEELLQSCDRMLDWLKPPCPFQVPSRPHSFLDKLALIFKPANVIRLNLLPHVVNDDHLLAEEFRLLQLGLYLARDRMQAVLDGDVQRFRETTHLQVQGLARRWWILFLRFSHPSFL